MKEAKKQITIPAAIVAKYQKCLLNWYSQCGRWNGKNAYSLCTVFDVHLNATLKHIFFLLLLFSKSDK